MWGLKALKLGLFFIGALAEIKKPNDIDGVGEAIVAGGNQGFSLIPLLTCVRDKMEMLKLSWNDDTYSIID